MDVTESTPKRLYKYAGADAGVKILQSNSLLWGSPDLFDSPFEMNGKCGLAFNSSELLDATVKLATSLIFNPERPKGDTPLVAAINRWREEERFDSPQEAQAVLADLLGKMVEQREEQLLTTQAKWQAFAEAIRINCFCEYSDVLSAWERYADNHKGIAIALSPDDENGLEEAHAVHYDKVRPQLTTLKEQLSSLLYNTPMHITQRFSRNLLHKPTHLKQEHEWRVLSPKDASFRKHEGSRYDEKMLTPGAIRAIYLGLNCEEATAQACIHAAKEMSPTPKIYKMSLAADEYRLEHTRANG